MKILVIRLSALGDVVRTLPALSCLRRARPDATIDWAVEEASRDILADQPDLDGLLVFPRRALLRLPLHPAELPEARAALGAFFARLKEARYDLVIDFQGTLKSAILARLTGAPRRVGLGRGQAREMSYLFYTDPVRMPDRRMSRVDRALALVAHLGIDTTRAESRIGERAEDAAYVELFLAALPRNGRAAAQPAVIFPGTSRHQAYKRYPPARFARAADLLSERAGAPVVVAWGPGEEEIASEVIASMQTPATLAPSLTLGQFTALIRRSRVFLAGDTGPMHIAWTVGTPVVAIYGPTDPVLNRPGGPFSTVAYRKVACSPCRNRGCIARTCLEQLPPEDVAEAALGVMHRAETASAERDADARAAAGAPGLPPGHEGPATSWETMGPGARPR